MALITEIPPGLTLPLKHYRAFLKTTHQTQTLMRKFTRKRVPRCTFPPATHKAIWNDWHLHQNRNLTRWILKKFRDGAAPMGKDWWTVFSGFVNPANYKGKSKHYRTVQCWMWFYKLYANYAGANWAPFNPAYDFTQYPPALPWQPPDPPTIDAVEGTAPLTLKIYFTYYGLGWFIFPITYFRLFHTIPAPPWGFTQYQSNTNHGWILDPWGNPIGCTLDLTPYGKIKPGNAARVGLRLWDSNRANVSEVTWQNFFFE